MKTKKTAVMMSMIAWLVVIWICSNIVGCTNNKKIIDVPGSVEEEITDKKVDNPVKLNDNDEDALGMVFFGYNESTIGHDGITAITKNAQVLKDGTGPIVIGGYGDQRGSDEYNIALGEKRGNNVMEFYKYLGIDISRMKVISYGKERPYDARHNEKAWARNRRVETVLKKGK